jgi:hypothetical protein
MTIGRAHNCYTFLPSPAGVSDYERERKMSNLRRVVLPFLVALVVVSVSGCDLSREAEGPTLQVLSPGDFTQVQLGESLDVVSAATDRQGVTRVELYVGDDLCLTQGSPTPDGETSWTFTQTWKPAAPGAYTLTIVAYNVNGQASTPWAVAVEVVEGPGTAGTPASTMPAATGTPPPSTGTAAPPSAATATEAPPPPSGATPSPPPAADTPVPSPAKATSVALPDLYIAEVTLNPGSTIVGEPVQVRIVVVNGGGAPAGVFTVNLVEQGGYWGRAWEQVGPLAAGEQAILEGTYAFKVADPENHTSVSADQDIAPGRVEESNEQNNGYTMVVNVQPAALPDLYIGQVALDPASPQVGQEVQVSVSLGNSGTGDAGPFTVTWKSEPDTVSCSWEVDGLAAGRTSGLTCPFTYTHPHSGQSTYTTADAYDSVVESDEENNVRYLRVNVRPAS